MMMISSLLSTLLLSATVILLAVGVVGRSSPSRPRCAACGQRLSVKAKPEPRCPSCRADLAGPRAVRFGGHRLRVAPLLAGLGLLVLIAAPPTIRAVRAGPTMQVVRGVTIDASVSEARLTEVLTAPAGPDWGSINVHLTEDLLSAAQRRRLGECIIKEIEVPFPSAELMRTLNKLGNAVDRGQAAEAMLRAVPPPRTVVTRADDVALHVVLNWPSEPFASPGASMVRCVGVTEIRVNGRAIRPKSPAGRFLTRLTPTSLALELGEGDAIDGVLEIEVDLAWAVLRDPPPHVVDWQLPGGPIELLPHAIAIRRQTLSQRVPAR